MRSRKLTVFFALLLTMVAVSCSNDESAPPVADTVAKYSPEELALWKEFRSRHESIVNSLSSQSPSTPEEARRVLAEMKNNSPEMFSNIGSSYPFTVVDLGVLFQTDQSEWYSLLLAHAWFDSYGIVGYADGHVERIRDKMLFDAVIIAGKGGLEPGSIDSVNGTIRGAAQKRP